MLNRQPSELAYYLIFQKTKKKTKYFPEFYTVLNNYQIV